ncbi:peptide-N4-(N-acetyl-beta-glucosaminyl)asparagine amidase A [Populus alba x Populus x berolinensis]|nr:peptide-N4-(N-acetyl-beta-glucosaminyl)asparagine amidase A [Populus alba x Populus x berolinensis]
MAASLFPLLFVFLIHPLSSTANIHKTNNLLKSHLFTEPTSITTTRPAHKPLNDTPPTVFFEVTKPIDVPNTKPCKHFILQHDFASTYGKPPVLLNYTPPSHCPSQDFSKIVLEWKATCKGRQFDRIFGVWLGGVELLRSCTAEPRATGIAGRDSKADLILPISRNLALNDGFWFEIQNSSDSEAKEFKIPQNVYRAVLEVYVSFHENDEFWYGNYPNEYITANNLTGSPGNGPFREVLVSLDGEIVGAVWPFTVVFTGGINPLLWRPITGIGSFDLPSYDIEITPFLGNILDGKTHKLGFSVTNALNVWYIDANLHLWLDHRSTITEGKLLKHESKPLALSLVSNFTGLNGKFLTSARRFISSNGWVKSSHGNITTRFNQHFGYSNLMEMGKDGDLQIVNQTIKFTDNVSFRKPSSNVKAFKSLKNFEFDMYSDYMDQGNGTSLSVANVTMGFNEKNVKHAGLGFASNILRNLQNGQGVMVVKNNLVQSGMGSTQQEYTYNGSGFCYFRNISSSNYTILDDNVGNTCSERNHSHLGFGLGRWWQFPARRASLASELLNKYNDGV